MFVATIAVFAIAATGSWALTRVLLPWLRRQRLVDVPNARSSHTTPTPRGGGVAIVLGAMVAIVCAWAVGRPVPGGPYFLAVGIVAVTGWLEDLHRGTPIPWRIGSQLTAALIIVTSSGGLGVMPLPDPAAFPLYALGVPVAVLWIVGVTNIYNFLDGIDGYASVQGIIAGIGLALLDWDGQGAVVGLALAGGCAGFLAYNWHPAAVFMGDVGSLSLGFAFASLPFQMETEVRADLIFATALLLWFFLSDGAFTLVRRLVAGQNIWSAHRSHLYQQLVQAGMSHSEVATLLLVVSSAVAGLAVVADVIDLPVARWATLASSVALFLAGHQVIQWAGGHPKMSDRTSGQQ